MQRSRLKDYEGDEGQAIVMVVLAMSIFLIGALGLAVDGSQLYAQRQMAQAAADAAAQAGMMSIYDGTSNAPGSTYTCAAGDATLPCVYALKNGFDPGNGDTVTLNYSQQTGTVNGVTYSADATNLLQVTVTRNVPTTLLRMLKVVGGSLQSTTVVASAKAAIVSVSLPVPLMVTHPGMWGALSMSGSGELTICGGPGRAIQVNSDNATAVTSPGNGWIDLIRAGPPGGCNGTGADFGVWGGPNASAITLHTGQGNYVRPSSPVQDPYLLAGVTAPPSSFPQAQAPQQINTNPGLGCTAIHCMLYRPGNFPTGINANNANNYPALFSPGIYYLPAGAGGITCTTGCTMLMAKNVPQDTLTGTNWQAGNIMFYIANGGGSINIGAGSTVNLTGAPFNDPNYPGILFFGDHGSTGNTIHMLGGGTAMNLTGSLYFTTTNPTATTFQMLNLSGPANITGHVIVDALTVSPGSGINIDLDNAAPLNQRQVAMVN